MAIDRDEDDSRKDSDGKQSGDDSKSHDTRQARDDKDSDEKSKGGKNEDDDEDADNDGEDEDEDSGPPLYKKPLFWIILIVVAIVLIVGGPLFWLHKRQYATTDDAFVDAHVVRIAAEEQGKLTHVAAIDNRHVEAGTLLATIEPYSSAASLDQAKAQAAQADAGIQQSQAQVVSAQAQKRQAAAQARDPEAQAVKAAADLQRYLALHQLDPLAVAATQIDQAREQAQSTAAQAAAARRAVDNAAAQVAVAQKQVKASRAQKVGAEAQILSAQVTYGHLDIRAPVSGQVVNRSVNLGSYVSAGTQLMAIVPDAMWITANFKETQLTHMQIGQHVDISVDAFPDVHFEGHVDSIQRGAGQAFALLPPQNATGNYVKVVQRVPVRILFDTRHDGSADPHKFAIGPGMSVVPTVKVR